MEKVIWRNDYKLFKKIFDMRNELDNQAYYMDQNLFGLTEFI